MRRFNTFRLTRRRQNGTPSEAEQSNANVEPSRGTLRRQWHQKIAGAQDVSNYLATGVRRTTESTTLDSLKRRTLEYLDVESDALNSESSRDVFVGGMIQDHAMLETTTRDVAVLAAICSLSTTVATAHLLSFADGEIGHYLRCVSLAKTVNAAAVLDQDHSCALSLLDMLSGSDRGFRGFLTLLRHLGTDGPLPLTPREIIERALDSSGVRVRLDRHLQHYLQKRELLKAHRLVQSFVAILGTPPNSLVESLLDKYFPKWDCFRVWDPNIKRITRWDEEPCVDSQRAKLLGLFDLDGPDTYTHRRASLMRAEPACYNHANVGIKSQDHLEQQLNVLYKAHGKGPGALDLFIRLCVEEHADLESLCAVDRIITMGDDSHCRNLALALKCCDPSTSLVRRIDALNQALPGFGNSMTQKMVETVSRYITDSLVSTLRSAQEKFSSQLEKGAADYLGMRIYALGQSIYKSTWIHSSLPDAVLKQVRNLPPIDVLEKLFDLMQDLSHSSDPLGARIKSYLFAILGGMTDSHGSAITLAGINEEIKFWKHPPDSLRKDFAKNLAKVRSMEHSSYTTCLLTMLKEEDVFIGEMKHMIRVEDEKSCLRFAEYLAHRRALNQLQHDCWLMLLVCLVREQEEQDSYFFKRMAENTSLEEWKGTADGLCQLISPIQSQIPLTGRGLTAERLKWWATLSRNGEALAFLLGRQTGRKRFAWLYFPDDVSDVRELLELTRHGGNAPSLDKSLVSYLSLDGSNLSTLCACIREVQHMSRVGKAVFERLLARKKQSSSTGLSESELNAFFGLWMQSRLLTERDKTAFAFLGRLLNLSEIPQSYNTYVSVGKKLLPAYAALMRRAKELESAKRMLGRQYPQQISALTQTIGIEDIGNYQDVQGVPDELVDAIEAVGPDEHEISFPVTNLNDLQRKARGLPSDVRIIHVRISLVRKEYCLHLGDDPIHQHTPWRALARAPHSIVCTPKTNLFTYGLCRDLHNYLSRRDALTLQTTHAAISTFISTTPATCLICFRPLNCKVWKRGTCSRGCSQAFRAAPLEIRCHNLLIDPLAVDLLLTSVYAAATDSGNLPLLPGCPVSKNTITSLIDSFPPLQTVTTASDLQSALQGSDGLGTQRIKFMSWLCISFRGFLLSAPNGYKIPSMPNSQQFLVVNSNHEREHLFSTYTSTSIPSGAVFHGTHPSRLFLILMQGLKNVSRTPLMLNGAAMGAGIYCGDDQGSSIGYAKPTGQSWKYSQLSNMRVMLGCELASYTPPTSGTFHCIAEENRLLVRYVFLLPVSYSPPIRAHVEPAMSIAFANLRSGLTN